VPQGTAPAPKVSPDQVLALLAQVEKVAERSPAQAREVLASVIEPVTLTPKPEGYEVSLTLRNETAALASGRTPLSESCGGAQEVWESPAPGPLSLFLPRLRGTAF
jgi:hypothetical protein